MVLCVKGLMLKSSCANRPSCKVPEVSAAGTYAVESFALLYLAAAVTYRTVAYGAID